MEASILLLLVSIAITVSTLLTAFSVSSFPVKVASAALSLLLSAVPVMIKLYFFYCERRTRRKLLLDATIRYFLGDAFPRYNFKSWCGGYSTYTNIFCEKAAFFSNEFYCVSVTAPSADYNVVTFGHIANATPEELHESQAKYVTERVNLEQGGSYNEEGARGTLVVRDYEVEQMNGVRYQGSKGEMFVRGEHKFERKAPFIPSDPSSKWVHVTYPKVYHTPSLGQVKVTLRYDHKNRTIDYKIQTAHFPEGLFTPKVQHCNIDVFSKCILMLEYMPADSGWVTYTNKCLGRRRRDAFIFHSKSLNGFTEDFKLGANLYEVKQQTSGLPCFID